MKDLLSIETAGKLIASIGAYFALLATPEKLIIASGAIMLLCVFAFTIWAYRQLKQSLNREDAARELFEKRFLLTEARTNALVDIHNKRHPEDTDRFYQLERLAAQKQYDELKSGILCGACSDSKDKHN